LRARCSPIRFARQFKAGANTRSDVFVLLAVLRLYRRLPLDVDQAISGLRKMMNQIGLEFAHADGQGRQRVGNNKRPEQLR
jgi:hypothetical protein